MANPTKRESRIHRITVTRIGYASRDFSIKHGSRGGAIARALDEAGDHLYQEHTSDYCVDGETTDTGLPLLAGPLTQAVVRKAVKRKQAVRGVVVVGLSEIVGRSTEEFLNFLSRKLVGSELLTDTNYQVVGVGNGSFLYIEVTGDASLVVEAQNGDSA